MRSAGSRKTDLSCGEQRDLLAKDGPGDADASVRYFFIISALFFCVLSVALFAAVLFNGGGEVWSKPGLDLTTALVPWWKFGFGEIAKGNFPLWNPHNFCGTPFFSNFNTGVLYPLHWINLLVPLNRALNLIGMTDVWIAGWFTSLWCRRRGTSPLGSIVGGVVFICSGPYFYHVYPGHEPVLAAVGWTPLILLSVDGIIEERSWRWALVGMWAVGLQILASFAQAVYLTGLIAGLYFAFCLLRETGRLRLCWLFAMIYAGGVGLGAVQLFPGLQTADESVRQSTTEDFAAQYSLPPENLLTLAVPRIFGDIEHSPYVGRSYLWEASLFSGVSTLLLAGCGAVLGDARRRRFSVTMLCVSVLLALGANVPWLFKVLFHLLPLYSSFRVTARFNWFITLYLAMLAGTGFDAVVGSRSRHSRPVAIALAGAGGAALLALVCLISARGGQRGIWGHLISALASGHDQQNQPSLFTRPGLILETGKYAAKQFAISAATLLATAVALRLLRQSSRYRNLLAGVTIAEMILFAHGVMIHGPMVRPYPQEWKAAAEHAQPDHRLLHASLDDANLSMIYGYDDVYGYDPVALKRYSDVLAMTQGYNPDDVHFAPQPVLLKYPRVFQMLRCEYVCGSSEGTEDKRSLGCGNHVVKLSASMRRLNLIDRFRVMRSRYEILAALADPAFDPHDEVILESPPACFPQLRSDLAAETAEVVSSSTDWMEIRAHLRRPAILLVTDSFSASWRACDMNRGAQRNYSVMPADYTLRAIPLSAGEHHFRLEYAPVAFYAGKWVSIVAATAWLAAVMSPWIIALWRSHLGKARGRPPAAAPTSSA